MCKEPQTKEKIKNNHRRAKKTDEQKKAISKSLKEFYSQNSTTRKISDEHRQRLIERNKKPISEETREKLRNRSRHISEETRRKKSESMKKVWINKERNTNNRSNRSGKKHSEETKGKISNSNKGKRTGKTHSEETKKRISEAIKQKHAMGIEFLKSN